MPNACIDKPVTIIGGGLAGCEAAWQLLNRGSRVTLHEMRPEVYTAAHKTPFLAELVCSNSLRSRMIENAVGLLKEEMRSLGSLVIEAADASALPAGKALAVDRTLFSRYVEERLSEREGLDILRNEVTEIPQEGVVIVASGPLTSDSLAKKIASLAGSDYLYFYDAIAPIVEAESIDLSKAFRASRYDSGAGDYLNCPLNRDEYETFYGALMEAKEVSLRNFEDPRYFEGCLPIEVMARRGFRTLLFGPMKPVGLVDPRTGREPYAVVQLRQENRASSLYNMVGFQTKLTWPEQKRIFRMIPALEKAEFARLGSIHRNTFLNAPSVLRKTLQLRSDERIFFAGQITGVEGYVESAATGLLAGIFAARCLRGQAPSFPPGATALGALLAHLARADAKTFQPMNINYGLFPALEKKTPRKDRGLAYAGRALAAIRQWKEEIGSVTCFSGRSDGDPQE
jgi:methylenetetrahydrofolate--tRNA-(uracil-5-)-methyltransferase